jgi:flagellin
MALTVNTNLFSLNAQVNLSKATGALASSVEHLSSGLRITRAADDAAGLGISETLRAHVRSINQAIRNANDGISLTQIADGAAGTIGSLLQRMRELAEEAASATVGGTERSYLDQEFVALRSEIDRISKVTEYNGVVLLSGSSNSFSIQVGFRSSANDTLTLALNSLDIDSIGLGTVNISTSDNAQSALANIDSAISAVATARAAFGSYQNRLQATIESLQAASVNLSAADSRIRDADFAYETAQFTKNQILVQSGVAVLAQANALPQQALALLR